MATVKLDWEKVIGKKSDAEDEGYVGDIMKVGIDQLTPLLASGAITQETQAMVITQLIDTAMGKAITFEKESKLFEISKLKTGV